MREHIYKFLDEYVGEGTTCNLRPAGLFRTWSENWDVRSDNGTLIVWFQVQNDKVRVYRSEELCKTIEGYFSIDPNESWKFIRDWFGIRNNLKVLSDLLKLIVK